MHWLLQVAVVLGGVLGVVFALVVFYSILRLSSHFSRKEEQRELERFFENRKEEGKEEQ